MEKHHVIALDLIDGQLVPVPPDELPDWNQPPDGLSRPSRRRWQKLFTKFRSKMPLDLAHYFASCRVARELGMLDRPEGEC